MSTTRWFSTGTILSITTGVLMTDIGKVYDILSYLTDDTLMTHQLPRASREATPYLLAAFPELADVDASGVNRDNVFAFLVQQVARLGDGRHIAPMPDGFHAYRHPVSEAVEMFGADRVVPVVAHTPEAS